MSVQVIICAPLLTTNYSRVRASIRAGDESHAVTATSWPKVCYANFIFNSDNCEDGLWQSALLVKVTSSSVLPTFHSNMHAGI